MTKNRVIEVTEVEDGYDRLAKSHHTYHDRLDSFEKGQFQKYLPRVFDNLVVVDLGAGDGRMYKRFAETNLARYDAVDVSKNMLAKHPSHPCVRKIHYNLDKDEDTEDTAWPMKDATYDVAVCFFTLEYIKDLSYFFAQTHRILKPGSRLILGYFLQRRHMIFDHAATQFKIETQTHKFEDILASCQDALFDVHVEEIFEKQSFDKQTHIGWILVCDKSN